MTRRGSIRMEMKGSAWRVVRLMMAVILLAAIGARALQLTRSQAENTRGLPGDFPAPIAEANVPSLGANVALEQYDDAELEAALKLLASGGFVWIRQSFYWHKIETAPGQFDWSTTDRIVARLARYPSLRLVAVLDDEPPAPPEDRDAFAAFTEAFAARYGDQVDYYQVWDDPNLAEHWGGGPVSPPAYADLLARTAMAIRSTDPAARILLAGLSPTVETGPQNLNDLLYLAQLYEAGAAPYFDIVTGKPYGFDTGPDDRRVNEAVFNFSRLILLHEVMEAHGDTDKAVWASHWGWNALPQGWTGQASIWGLTDEVTQATRTVEALNRARIEWPWCGALILENFQPAAPPEDARWGFALVGQDGTPRPAYEAVRNWAETLPDAAPVGGYPALNPWVRYEGSWHVGPLGADVGATGDRAVFNFDGTGVALTLRRGPYRAYLYVTVDGEPAPALPRDASGRAYVTLYDEEPIVATVPLAVDLEPGPHSVEIVAERGQGQWLLVDWRVGSASPAGHSWKIAGLALAGCALLVLVAFDAHGLPWRDSGRRFLMWPEWVQVCLVVAITGTLWATAGASWSHVAEGTATTAVALVAFPASLALLAALVVLLSLRPDLGLGLAAASAPFYLQPAGLLALLSLPELLTVVCALGVFINRWFTARHQKQKARTRLTLIDAGVIAILTAAILSSLGAADRRATLFELRAIFAMPALYYLLLRIQRPDARMRRRLIGAYLAGAAAVALIGIVQYALRINVTLAEAGLPRMKSVYTSPNNAGLYLARAWPLVATAALWSKTRKMRTIGLLAVVVVMLGLVLTFSRGALVLGIPAAILVMGWLAGGRYRVGAIAIVLLGALALIPLMSVPRFASMLDLTQGSTFFRIELWRSSLTMLREHPLLGVGPGNFRGAYRSRYILPNAWGEPNQGHPHNIVLDHWTRLGLLGLAAGVVIQVGFWRGLRRAWRSGGKDPVLIGLAGSMAVLLAHGLVDNTMFAPDLTLASMLVLAVVGEMGRSYNHETRRDHVTCE